MIDFTRLGCNAEDNGRWNDFLQAWPLERLRNMSLADYTQAGSAETFTAWLEQRLEKMGSMWGGSAFKFGIFSRANKEKREDRDGARYTDAYGWTGKYGDTPDAAFAKIRSLVVAVAEAASRGDTAAIDGIDLGPVYKWKIAFHYQNPEAPTVLAIYKPEPLRQFLKSTAPNVPLSQLYRDVLAKKPADTPLMEFCGDIYAAWQDNLPLWKVAHPTTSLSAEEHERLLRGRLMVINPGASQALTEQFRGKAKVGDLFYLCRDASVALLGRMTTAPCARTWS